MKITETSIRGLLIIDLDLHRDNRGWFKENWHRAKMVDLGLPDFGPVQNNISFNADKGVTRGLHAEPWDKFISVAAGSVHGAWMDLREGSSTYGEVIEHEITPEVAVYVPRGIANGFQALEDGTAYTYLVNAHWSSTAKYSFTNLSQIDWPLKPTEISEKDKQHPLLHEAEPVPELKVLVVGANGQLGRALAEVRPDYVFLGRDQFDITNPPELDWSGFSTVINCAAYTNVDGAESDAAGAWAVNARGPKLLTEIARDNGLDLLHVSTDYVFDGSSATPYSESDPLSPLGVYGASKAAGELTVSSYRRSYVVRTSWVIGEGKNFVRTMTHLAKSGSTPKVVDDQIGRPTFARDLANFIAHIVDHRPEYGIYHFSNSGDPVSWYRLAQEVFDCSGSDPERVTPTSSSEYFKANKGAPRPLNSLFDLRKVHESGFEPENWRVALTKYMEKERG